MFDKENYIKKIQNQWKIYLIRRRIKLFSQLPNDLWFLILNKLNQKYFHRGVDNIIENKIIKIYYLKPDINNLKYIFKTIFLIRKYVEYLHSRTVSIAINLCYKCLQIPYINLIQSYYINSFIEFMIINKYYNHNILHSKMLF